jgi:hypothetical protein
VIKVTFEGKDYDEVAEAMAAFLKDTTPPKAEAKPVETTVEEFVAKRLERATPEEKAILAAAYKKALNKERMAKARAAKGKKKAEAANGPDYTKQLKQDLDARPIEAEAPAASASAKPPQEVSLASPFDEPEPEPELNLVALRIKTTEELQKAFAEGKHTQVMALLSKYGNGAKSFRELRVEDFVPLRKAIDDGALT